MKVDLRDKIKKEKMRRELSVNHRILFEQKLQKELHAGNKNNYFFLKIAAAVILLFSIGYFTLTNVNNPVTNKIVEAPVKLEDFSPDLKKIENYYLTAINYEIANLKITDDNKLILEEYFNKIRSLTNEYKVLNKQLNLNEIDEELINNLIDNLQLRLFLLTELKKELKNIKTKKDEEHTI